MSKIQEDGTFSGGSSLSSDFKVFKQESIPSLIQSFKKNSVTGEIRSN
jgi:hypothetical protein